MRLVDTTAIVSIFMALVAIFFIALISLIIYLLFKLLKKKRSNVLLVVVAAFVMASCDYQAVNDESTARMNESISKVMIDPRCIEDPECWPNNGGGGGSTSPSLPADVAAVVNAAAAKGIVLRPLNNA